MIDERVLRAADAAYGVYYPATNPKFSGRPRAWKGPPEKNPLLRPLLAALADLSESTDRICELTGDA